MSKTLNITSSNFQRTKKRELERVTDIGMKEFKTNSSLPKKKGKKKMVRLLSAGNINPKFEDNKNNTNSNFFNLPPLNGNSYILSNSKKMKHMNPNNSADRKKEFKIELEKIYEQNIQYKRTIKNLQSQIKLIKQDTEEKEIILNQKREEINSIIKENTYKSELDAVPIMDSSKLSLVRKIRNQIKQSGQELQELKYKYSELKKDLKQTKKKESLIEEKIYDAHRDKILVLINNSKQYKISKSNEVLQNEIVNNGLENQQKIMKNLANRFNDLDNEEEFLNNEIIKYEKYLDKALDKLKIIKLNHISLKEQNTKLKKEKENFIDKNGHEDYSLEKYNKKLIKVKKDYIYNKLKSIKTMEKLSNLKKKYNTSFEQYKKTNEIKNNIPSNINTTAIDSGNITTNDISKKECLNIEDYLNKLKNIYQENREKENELEKGLFLYQKAVRNLNNPDNVNIAEIKENLLNIINNNKKNKKEVDKVKNNDG